MVVSQTQEKEPGEHSGRKDRSAIVGIWEVTLKREDYTGLAGGYYLREAGLFRAFADTIHTLFLCKRQDQSGRSPIMVRKLGRNIPGLSRL